MKKRRLFVFTFDTRAGFQRRRRVIVLAENGCYESSKNQHRLTRELLVQSDTSSYNTDAFPKVSDPRQTRDWHTLMVFARGNRPIFESSYD